NQLGTVGSQYLPVRIKKGEKAAKALKELSGVISAQILTPAVAHITADKVLEANGKTFKGTEGGAIKVTGVDKTENGPVTIRFELEQPANVVPANKNGGVNGPIFLPGGGVQIQPGQGAAQIQVQIKQGVIVQGNATPAFQGAFNGVTLQDDKGNVLPVAWGQQIRKGVGGVTVEYT